MGIKTYGTFSTRATPQSEPVPGEAQVANHAGGYAYAVSPWVALDRFLVLGTEGGTYYVEERPLTLEAAQNVLACLALDGKRVVDAIVAVSDAGRAPKNDPAIFALACAAAAPDPATRAYALAALPAVCRIPTHLFHFLAYVGKQRGFGRGLRTALARWYARWDENQLAYELAKYQGRDGWTNRDALRKAHGRLGNRPALRWAIGASTESRTVRRVFGDHERVDQYGPAGELPAILQAYEEAKTADTAALCRLIHDHNLTREMVPSAKLAEPDVWAALLERMPLTALLRNLGTMGKVGLLKPLSQAARTVAARLGDQEALLKSRVHPVAVLLALKTYAGGKGVKGSGTWKPVPQVVDALDAAFYTAFGGIIPTGKRLLYALDVSGSMSSAIGGLPLSCAEGAAAMAMACLRVEPEYYAMGFSDTFRDLGLTPRMRLDDVLRRTRRMNFGPTDCALPMTWALKEKVQVDGFVVITDNETWYGDIHPSQALRRYRERMGIEARQVVMAMTVTNFSIADPKDPRALDVVGFDAATPQAVAEFLR